MALGPRLDLRQSQTLIMTPQLRQAIKLLQFSNLEVAAFIDEELERNPLLDRDESAEHAPERPAADQAVAAELGHPDTADLLAEASPVDRLACPADRAEPWEGTAPSGSRASSEADHDGATAHELTAHRQTLREYLAEQLRLCMADPAERRIGAHLIALLDPAGRLTAAPHAIAAALRLPLATVEAVRARMQEFDPVGLFCVDLRECLQVQLAERGRLDASMQVLLAHLELLARREFKRLLSLCGVDTEQLAAMIAELRALDPKPAAGWDAAPLVPLIPDILMRRVPSEDGHGAWLLELNPDTLPRVLVNHGFAAQVAAQTPRAERGFLTEKLQTANWLVKSLHQRAQTILKVTGEIVRQQDGFFRHGAAHLRPLILRDIADAVELHESTVSRVTANKYLATPRGTFELRYFFNATIAGMDGETHSAESVRHRIRALVGAEAAGKVLSDDAIVTVLRQEGVDIARRTVAKYRDALHIPSSMQRKRDKVVLA